MDYLLQQVNGDVMKIDKKLSEEQKTELNNLNLFDLYHGCIFPNSEISVEYSDFGDGLSLTSLYMLPFFKKMLFCLKKEENLENFVVKNDIKHISLLRINFKNKVLEELNDDFEEFLVPVIDSILIECGNIGSDDYYNTIVRLKKFGYKILEKENKNLIFGFKVFDRDEKKRLEMEKFING